MAVFDWIKLFDERNIPYVTKGSNVKRGNVNLTCPFCGNADTGMHMGLDPQTGYWGCWRNDAHRGKSPLRLLVALLKIPYHKAREMAGYDESFVDLEEFNAVADRFMGRNKEEKASTDMRDYLTFPVTFIPLDANPFFAGGRYQGYLESRGFAREDLIELCSAYNLRATLDGGFKDRLILPYYVDGKLVTWTARAIATTVIRYKDLNLNESLLSPKHTLFNHDAMLGGGRVLLVVEGPLDVLKLDFYGKDYGVRAVGLSTNSIRDRQIYTIEDYACSFDRVLFMMDNNNTGTGAVDSMRMKSKASHIPNSGILRIPFGRKDGGEMTPEEVIKFSKGITK